MPDHISLRLELMRNPVRVIDSSGRQAYKPDLTVPESQLLRILAFEPGALKQEDLLDGLLDLRRARSNARGLQKIGPLLSHIKRAVGQNGIETVTSDVQGGERYENARYRGNLSGFQTDAAEFSSLCTALGSRINESGELWMAPESLPHDFGAATVKLAKGHDGTEVELWDEVLTRYPVNPSVPLNNFPAAYAAYNEFAEHQWTLIKAIALGYACRFLNDGQDTWLSRAESRLQRLGRESDVPDEIWMLRFRLVASLDSWRVAIDEMRRRYLRSNNPTLEDDDAHDLQMPSELETFVAALRSEADRGQLDAAPGNHVPHLLLPRVRRPKGWVPKVDVDLHLEGNGHEPNVEIETTADLVAPSPITPFFEKRSGDTADPGLLEVATMLGITPASSVALRSSNTTPVECINQVDKRLWFSGIMANKWVLDPEAHQAFDVLLTELDSYDETDPLCRLLIVNPDSRAGAKLKKRGLITDRELRSIPVLQNLVEKHPSFEVRMYETLPIFRLIIVDQVFVTVAPYLNVLPDLIPDRGWGVPHLVLKPSAEYPLAHSFVSLFEQNWDACRSSGLPMP